MSEIGLGQGEWSTKNLGHDKPDRHPRFLSSFPNDGESLSVVPVPERLTGPLRTLRGCDLTPVIDVEASCPEIGVPLGVVVVTYLESLISTQQVIPFEFAW